MDQETIAKGISTRAHNDQKRRDGKPYMTHIKSVVHALATAGSGGDQLAVGWLHDVLEDTPLTADELLDYGVSEKVVRAVQLLTKIPGEPYKTYLQRVKTNQHARVCKVADLLDNISDNPAENLKPKQLAKYKEAVLYLLQ